MPILRPRGFCRCLEKTIVLISEEEYPEILYSISPNDKQVLLELEQRLGDDDRILQLNSLFVLSKITPAWKNKAFKRWIELFSKDSDARILEVALNHILETRQIPKKLIRLIRATVNNIKIITSR